MNLFDFIHERRKILCSVAVVVQLFLFQKSSFSFILSEIKVEGLSEISEQHVNHAVKLKYGENVEEKDVHEAAGRIYDLGYFAFVDYKTIPNKGKIIFEVSENPVVKSLVFSGNSTYKDEILIPLMMTSPGTVFNGKIFKNDISRIEDKYVKGGYPLSGVVDVVQKEGDIEIFIVEPKIGEIIIVGNKKTKTETIAREIKFKQREVLNIEKLHYYIGVLQNKGWFSDVSTSFEKGFLSDEVNLIVRVEEKKTAGAGISVSHGSSSGWAGGLSYNDANISGKGISGEIGFETGGDEKYWLNVGNPYSDSNTYSWRFGIDIKDSKDLKHYENGELKKTYNERKNSVGIVVGRNFGFEDKWKWNAGFERKESEIYDEKDENGGSVLEDGTVSSISLSLTYDDLNKYSALKQGSVYDLTAEQAVEILGGEFDYTKVWLQTRTYKPLSDFEKWFGGLSSVAKGTPTFALRSKIGTSFGDLPSSEKYSLGGANSLRGYETGEFEGTNMFMTNVELRVPIQKAFSVAAFVDVGKAWENEFSLDDLKYSWGMGVRIGTPLGSFRVDYAKGDKDSKTHFGFGETF